MQEDIKKLQDELEDLDWSFEDIYLTPEQTHLFISLIIRDQNKWSKLVLDPVQIEKLEVYLGL